MEKQCSLYMRSGLLGVARQAPFLVAWMFCASYAAAESIDIFESIEQQRTVAISASLSAYNFETLTNSSADFDEFDEALPNEVLPLRLGMNIDLKDAFCYGQGMASQSLIVGPSSIQFDSVADINLSGMGGYPFNLNGSGGASTGLSYSFRLREAQLIDLSMSSSIGAYRDDDFSFSLKSETGTLVWGATAIVGSDGDVTRSFSSHLLLGPGVYTVSVRLNAFSNLTNDMSMAGRTTARFAISAVPEPHAIWLALLGVGVTIVVARFNRPKRQTGFLG